MKNSSALGCIVLACAGFSGCTVVPSQMDAAERDRIAAESRERLFAGQDAPSSSVTLAEATARSVKYYADYRLRLMEEAAAAAQLDVARFDLLPRLTTTAGYTTRNNDAFGFGFSPGGTIATNPSASSERTRETLTIGLAWNVLDFGVSYFRAKQLADQSLIAQERRRKAVQTLVHDVRQAWWRAEAAQRLLPEIDELFDQIEHALEKTRVIEARKLLPPMQVVSLRRALIDLQQQISFRRQELAQARVELSALINIPPGSELVLATVAPASRRLFDLSEDMDRLEAAALRNRPEISEEGYRARISEAEAKKAMLAVMPNLTFDLGYNFDSNRFLVNNIWTSAGVSLAFNLVKAFSIPALNRSAEAQKKVDEARRLAMAMAVLAQTRIATVRYSLVLHEHGVWNEAASDDEQIVKLLVSSAEVGVDTELELIRAKARLMVSKINRDLSYANLEAAVARIYNSVGFDAIPQAQEAQGVAELTKAVEARFSDLHRSVFASKSEPALPTVAISAVGGVDARTAALMHEGMDRVIRLSKVRLSDESRAEMRISVVATLLPARSGVRSVKLGVRVLDAVGGRERFETEFRTTLSEPVDDEQMRVVGEGAAYRVMGWLSGNRISRGTGSPRASSPASMVVSAASSTDSRAHPLDGGPLPLKLDDEWQPALRYSDSRLGAAGLEATTPESVQ
jgi:outer membrane protein TolC